MMYKLRTVDVWDTLLRRDCHPECIKLATAHYLKLGWHTRIRPEFDDSWALYRARVKVEHELGQKSTATGSDDEYEITNVIRSWLSNVLFGPSTEDMVDILVEYEIQVEIDRCHVDNGIVEFLSAYEAERTIFLSDFYMTSSMLRRILEQKGVNEPFLEGIASCDVGLNKRSGGLFRYALTRYGVAPNEHIHIGDNSWSDVEAPRQLGIQTAQYLPEVAHAKRLQIEALFSSRSALFDHIVNETTQLDADAVHSLPEERRAAYALGAEAAPLFVAFALWIAEEAQREKLDRIYFFTREGEFFYGVLTALFPDGRVFGYQLPECRTLEVSRLSTFAPSISVLSAEEMARIWSLFKVQSVTGLFVTLGLSVANFKELIERIGLNVDDVVEDPKNSPELRELFEDEAFIGAASDSIERQRDNLRTYLAACGLQKGERVGVVDIGWRGTIQDNLALLVPDTHFHGMYLGLRRFINKQPDNVTKRAYVHDENASGEVSWLFTNFAAMELLCSSSYGSVVGYGNVGGAIAPIRQIDESEDSVYESFVGPFQRGIVAAANGWSSYLKRYVVSSKEIHELSLRVWDTLRRSPSELLVQAYLNAPQHDMFGYGEIFRRNRYPSLRTIFLSPFVRKCRRELIEYVRRVQWSEAIQKAAELGWMHRSLLVLIFRAANYVKRIRRKL